jgi:hypothetical protein
LTLTAIRPNVRGCGFADKSNFPIVEKIFSAKIRDGFNADFASVENLQRNFKKMLST